MARKKTKIECGYDEFIPHLTEAQIIEAVDRVTNKGQWRYVTWFHKTFMLPGSTDKFAVVFRKSCRIGINPDKVRGKFTTVSTTGAVTRTKSKESVYTRFKEDKFYFLRLKDQSTDEKKEKKFLQCLVSNQHDTRKPLRDEDGAIILDGKHRRKFAVKSADVFYYKNGVLVDPVKDAETYEKILRVCPPKKSGNIDVWVLPLKKIIEIK